MTQGVAILPVIGLALFFVYLSVSLVRRDKSGFELPVLVLIFMLLGAAYVLFAQDVEDAPLAVVSGLLIAASALFGLVFNAAVARQTESRRRQEKRIDMRRALRAEIDDYVLELLSTGDKRGDGPISQAFASEDNFVPFLIAPRRDKVFSTVLQQIEVLDDRQVETIVRFFALHEKVVDLSVRMQSADYAALSEGRRKAVLKSLHNMENLLIDYGNDALETLGGKNARRKGNAPSRTDQAHSDREAVV